MESFEGIWDFDIEKIDADIMDTKEKARINKIISELGMYKDDMEKLTQIYTNILKEENVVKIMTKVSQSINFYNNFPEFYVYNENGENVINCQQNSKYHKYGVFRHTLEAVKSVGKNRGIPYSDYEMKILKWTMLLHDIGKPAVKTTNENGNDSFLGHEDVSEQISKGILERFKFTGEEKEIILKLIKYHDKYINQGEITYDNMKFLASELGNNKRNFNLLLEVKEADAKAKSDEVYEVYLQVKQKYMEFIGSYFSFDNSISTNTVIGESVEGNLENVRGSFNAAADITNSEYEQILIDTINRKNINVYYQPMVDIKDKKVAAYETYSKIEHPKSIAILDLLNYSKKVGKFDKIQQVLMINNITEFENVENKESKTVFVNIDFESYNKYINKPRIYDMMSKNRIVIEFKNYSNASDLEITIKTIKQHGGYVSLDNYGVGNISLDKLVMLKPNFVKFDVEFLNNISVDSQKQRYLINVVNTCMANDIDVIAVGVEDRETLITLKNIGLRYIQGYFFGYPDKAIKSSNKDIENTINSINNENSL